MLGTIKRKVVETKYRLKIKQALQQASTDELRITLDETRKEIQRRCKK